MSEFLAEASVLIRPDTTKFRAQLEAKVLAATKGIVVPVAIGGGSARNAAQVGGALKTLGTTADNTTAKLLGAASATGRLDAALLGLRTAIGSSAVIGLGALSLAAIAAGAALRSSLQNFASFQQELSTFRVTAGASAEQMAAVSAAATRLGDDVRLPAVSAADAAVAMTELAKAGLSVEDSIAGAEGVLQLATAAQLSNADAAKIAANALNSFGLAGDQATRVADDFANAANAAQGSIADVGLALQQSSAVARQVGLSLEDTTAILSLFAKNGLQGSDAGTSLRVALIRLVAPTKAAADEIKKLGLQIRDSQGNLRADVFAQFGQATENLAPKIRDAAAALIFGQDAIRAVAIGAREGTDGLRLMQFQIDQTGTAAEVSAARTEGLAGQFSALQSEAQTLSIQFGKLISGPLGAFVTSLSDIATGTTKAIQGIQNLSDELNKLSDSFPGGGKANDFLNSFGKFAATNSPVTVAVGLVERLGIGGDKAAQKLKTLTDELRSFQQARVAAEQGGDSALADRITKKIEALKNEIDALKTTGGGIDTGVNEPLRRSLATLEKLRETVAPQDVPFIDSLIRSLKEQIPASETANANAGILRDTIDSFGKSAAAAAGGVDALTKALKDLGRQSSVLDAQLLKLQNENASPQAIILNRQADIAKQKQIIAGLKANGNQVGDASAITAARQKIESDQAEIAQQQALIVSATQKAASDAKSKADEIAKNQEAATKNFIAGFDPKKQKILNQITAAGFTERFSDDVKFEKLLKKFLRDEITAIQNRIKNLHLHGAALKAAQEAIAAINQEIFNTTQQIAKDQASAQERTQEIINQKLDLRVQIAQDRGDVAAEIKARRARLAAITKELVKLKNDGKKNTVAWLQLKDQQIQEINAIKDLEGKTKEKDNAQNSLFFQFLQTQQGFAANLLGNLIPGFATSGLVGGSSAASSTAAGDPFAFTPNAAEINTGVGGSAAVAAGKGATVRPVQVDTTNSLLRQILAALQGRPGHPEAQHQRQTATSSYYGPDHGF